MATGGFCISTLYTSSCRIKSLKKAYALLRFSESFMISNLAATANNITIKKGNGDVSSETPPSKLTLSNI